jgi:hypothetical protein
MVIVLFIDSSSFFAGAQANDPGPEFSPTLSDHLPMGANGIEILLG